MVLVIQAFKISGGVRSPFLFGEMGLGKTPKELKESLERLKNSYEQAKVNGDKNQIRFLKAIIDRIENGQNKGNRKA